MVPLIIVAAIPAGIIVVVHLVLFVGIIIARIRERTLRHSPEGPSALSSTVVVPARNEELLLPRLLESLESQSDKSFHMILVDDRSTDATGDIMDRFAATQPERVRVVHVTEKSDIGNPKLNALILGVDGVKSDCMLFTDADCVAPPEWIARMSASFANERVGLVLGPIETVPNGTVISRFHSFDHVFKFSYNAACTGIDQATGGFGNNLAIRTAALEQLGGMRSIDVTVTEDAALVTAMRDRTVYLVRTRFDRDVTVHTQPQPDIRRLTNQEVRWHTGGLFSPDPFSRFNYRFIMCYLTISVLSIVPAVWVWPLWILPAVSFATMSGMAILSGLFTHQSVLQYWAGFVPFLLFEMAYDSFLTIVAMLKPTLTWKGESLRSHPFRNRTRSR